MTITSESETARSVANWLRKTGAFLDGLADKAVDEFEGDKFIINAANETTMHFTAAQIFDLARKMTACAERLEGGDHATR